MLCFASPQPSVSRLALLHMSKFGSVTEADQGLFFLGYSQSCRSSITINIRTLSSPQRKPYTRYQSLPISSQTSPSVCVCVCVCEVSHSVVSDSLGSHGLQPTRLLCPWNSPGKNTGVGSHALLQGILPTQGSNLDLLHCRQVLYRLSHRGSLLPLGNS